MDRATCHLDTHTLALIDPLGRLLATRSFAASTTGYTEASAWMSDFGPVIAAGVESTGGYGAALTRHLRSRRVWVNEINHPHPHTQARRGKDDPIDAEAAARKVLSGEATAAAKDTTGIVESIRQLAVGRVGAVKARSAALCQLGDLITTAPAELRERLTERTSLEGKAMIYRALRVAESTAIDPHRAAKLALRSIARRIADLSQEIDTLDAELDRLVKLAAPTTITRLGIGTGHAATLLVAAGQNVDRLNSEAAFAHLCGVAPIPASSGRTTRRRLKYSGNRQANRALHMIVIVRLRYYPTTQAYMARRLAEERTKKEVIRCLKRYIIRDTYRTPRADLAAVDSRPDVLQEPPGAIHSGRHRVSGRLLSSEVGCPLTKIYHVDPDWIDGNLDISVFTGKNGGVSVECWVGA